MQRLAEHGGRPVIARFARPVLWLPLAAAVILLALGRTTGGLVLGALGLVRLGLVFAPRADAAVDRGLRHIVHVVATGLGRVLLWTVGIVIIVPANGFCRLTGVDPLGRARADGWWRPSGQAPADRAYSGRATDGSAASASVPRRLVRVALVLVVLGSGVVIVRQLRGTDPLAPIVASDALPAALAHQPQAHEMQAQEGAVFAALRPDPDLGWTLPDTAPGTLVGVRDRTRVTPTSGTAGPVIWLFGGSALWGSGQRNDHTIASDLATALRRRGTPAQVVNWGVFAYTSVQEARAFRAAVARYGPPDLVVFYDGYNDIEVGMGTQLEGLPPGSQAIAPLEVVRRSTVLHRAPGRAARTTADRVQGVVDAYDRSMADARAVARAHHVPMVQVWQPSAFTRDLTAAERADLGRRGYTPSLIAAHRSLNDQVRRKLPSQVVDLSDSLDGAPTVFIDQVHTNEIGARLVADALYRRLEPELARLDG